MFTVGEDNDYSYNVPAASPGGMAGPEGGGSQYEFGHVQAGPPPSSYMQRMATGAAARTNTGAAQGASAGPERPITSNRGAGYSAQAAASAAGKSAAGGGFGTFDPLNQASDVGVGSFRRSCFEEIVWPHF